MTDDLRPSTNFVDLTGYKCGALRAVRPVGKDRHGHYLWECVCEKCGKKKVVNYVQFREGSMRDCGCTPVRGYDITGQEKGHLTAIMPVGHDKKRRRIWEVRCDICRKKSTMTATNFVKNEHPRCPICGS